MKKNKAKSWEEISEGTLTKTEIACLEKFKQPITMVLSNFVDATITSVQIVPVRGPSYDIISQGLKINKKPFKYLSCAVRRAVKEYKTIIRTGKWKCLTKI